MAVFEELKVFSGTAHPTLAKEVCDYLGITPGRIEAFKFSNDNTFVRLLENVRQRDVFLIQPLSVPVNDNLMELLIAIDAAKRASAGRITAVVPYYAYGRTDHKDQPRVPITARLVADMITTAGADRVLTIDLHAPQIQGFFNIPVDELSALQILTRHFRAKDLPNLVVVATDVGGSKRARNMARHLDVPLAIVEKQRLDNRERVEALNLIGDVENHTALIVDDEVDTGGTLLAAVDILLRHGAREAYACCIHPILSGNAMDRLVESPVKELVVTDTIPVLQAKRNSKIKVLSVASLLGEAIHRIHSGLSVGAVFEQEW